MLSPKRDIDERRTYNSVPEKGASGQNTHRQVPDSSVRK